MIEVIYSWNYLITFSNTFSDRNNYIVRINKQRINAKTNNPNCTPNGNGMGRRGKGGVGEGIMCFLCYKIEADMQNLVFAYYLCMSCLMRSWRL